MTTEPFLPVNLVAVGPTIRLILVQFAAMVHLAMASVRRLFLTANIFIRFWRTNFIREQIEQAMSKVLCRPVPRHDPRLLLLAAYSTVIGVATEVEVLRALGFEPTARSLVRRRAELLAFLRSALVADGERGSARRRP